MPTFREGDMENNVKVIREPGTSHGWPENVTFTLYCSFIRVLLK